MRTGRAVWLPENVRAMTDLNDYRTLGKPINALYLTPVSGSRNKLSDILKGEYKEWARGYSAQHRSRKSFRCNGRRCLVWKTSACSSADHDRERPETR